MLRSTWDYAERRDEFLAWARSLPCVLNEPRLLEWNTDKHYLEGLDSAGVPIVPTEFVPPGEPLPLPDRPYVIKPAISAGGRSSARFEPDQADEARALLRRIHGEGRDAMVQPFIADAEETALVYIGGRYSHSLARRVPLPASRSRTGLYLTEQLAPAKATVEQCEIAEAALACAPGETLYGRVDLLGGAVLELELTEPSLYLAFGTGSADRLAAAIAERVTLEA